MLTIQKRAASLSVMLAAALIWLAAALAIAADPSPGAADSMPAATETVGAPSGTDCFTLEPGTLGEVVHPTEPEAIVLRMSQGGGFVPSAIAFIDVPQFTLYGNDVAIFQAPVPPDAQLDDPRPAFQCLRLTPEQVDELLTFALDQGGLADAGTDYPNPNITDVGSTIFSVNAEGVDKVVSVFALGFDMAPEDQLEDRARFALLEEHLARFGEEVEGEVPYAVPGFPALLEEDFSDTVPEQAPWPWPDLAPDDFALGDPASPVVLTPEQVAAVTEVPNGGQAFIPIESPDGADLVLSLRPLLPDDRSAG
jgi:hypothetical protein